MIVKARLTKGNMGILIVGQVIRYKLPIDAAACERRVCPQVNAQYWSDV